MPSSSHRLPGIPSSSLLQRCATVFPSSSRNLAVFLTTAHCPNCKVHTTSSPPYRCAPLTASQRLPHPAAPHCCIEALEETAVAKPPPPPVKHQQFPIPSTLPPPPPLPPAMVTHTVTLDFTKPKESFTVSATMSISSLSFLSSLTGDGSVTGKIGSSILVPAVAVSAGKPPLASSSKRKIPDHVHVSEDGKQTASGSRCHCTKKR
ncbi:WRKY transcription factor WRKY51 isoform X2 [Canna indica]|uniref:WRKY transcription factor WRKY51 isoform X2 n=1 Tax=Canna indica TaxID=4628 RepID=A0AAQ3LBS1_9LILI|nr:WRKY transcription factor WRKY51 isoform X2 [Canna indica]